MSDNTTDTTTAPENVVSFPAASETNPVNNAPEASSATEPSQQPASTDASATPAAAPAEGSQTSSETSSEPQINSIQDAVAHVINNIDLNTVSHHDVVHDLFRGSQDFAFKLMLAAKLFEQMLIRDAGGLKGEAFDLLRHADEAVVNEVHAILKEKVAVPTPTEVIPPNEDQAVS
jgi:hypothetical protein